MTQCQAVKPNRKEQFKFSVLSHSSRVVISKSLFNIYTKLLAVNVDPTNNRIRANEYKSGRITLFWFSRKRSKSLKKKQVL